MRVTIETIIPRRFDYVAMKAVLRKEAAVAVKEMRKDYEKTTRTWKHQPDITPYRWTPKGFPAKFKVSVGPKKTQQPEYAIFGYVDLGTRPHKIKPKKPGGVLAFMWGGKGSYKAKSRPRKLRAYSGGVKGGKLTFRNWVQHPGTKPRHFTKTIQKKWDKLLKPRFDKAMKRAAGESNHRWSSSG